MQDRGLGYIRNPLAHWTPSYLCPARPVCQAIGGKNTPSPGRQAGYPILGWLQRSLPRSFDETAESPLQFSAST